MQYASGPLMKVLVNPTGWEMTAEAAEEPTPEATGAVVKSSGVYAKTHEPDRSPESFSPTEPAPASDDPLDNEVTLPPPPSLPRIALDGSDSSST
ncbi:MAG: hypothetical protein HOV80_29315 [Polyangiaceae bacterium]|nr:hypothetical protein [Polyangiaceae bacterium]